MSHYTEALRIDPDAARRLAVAYTGYGEASRSRAEALRSTLAADRAEADTGSRSDDRQRRTRVEEAQIVAASALCIGASYYALIDASAAKVVYWTAAQVYRDLGMPYGAIMAICAEDTALERIYWNEFAEQETLAELTPANAAPMMLIAADMLVRDRRYERRALSIIDLSRGMEGALIGSAQIPMGFYNALATEAWNRANDESTLNRSSLASTTIFLTAWVERLRLVQLDSFHWKHLHPQLLPVEPEVLAAAKVIVRALNEAGANIQRALDQAELSESAKVVVEIAIQLSDRDMSASYRGSEPLIRDLIARRNSAERRGRDAL
jgi:hypothetical protein